MSQNPWPRVLIFSYACDPDGGSEAGAGWGLVQSIASYFPSVVLVSSKHKSSIQRWQKQHVHSTLSFTFVPELSISQYVSWHRIPHFLWYRCWLKRAYKIGKQLHAEQPFDLVYHATYSAYWLPSPGMYFDLPFVWGPVGGGVFTPLRLWPLLGWKGVADELLDFCSVRLASFSMNTRRTWKYATIPIVQNTETLIRFPKAVRNCSHVFNHAVLTDFSAPSHQDRKPVILYVSPLESRKGPRLAIRAMLHVPGDARLLVVGDGPEAPALRRLAERLGLSHRVQFLGRVDRQHVFELLAMAAVAVFTGLREEGGLSLAEAMLQGTPVIVLAHGGAKVIAEAALNPRKVVLIPPRSINYAAQEIGKAMMTFIQSTPADHRPNLDQPAARERLKDLCLEAIARKSSVSPELTRPPATS